MNPINISAWLARFILIANARIQAREKTLGPAAGLKGRDRNKLCIDGIKRKKCPKCATGYSHQ